MESGLLLVVDSLVFSLLLISKGWVSVSLLNKGDSMSSSEFLVGGNLRSESGFSGVKSWLFLIINFFIFSFLLISKGWVSHLKEGDSMSMSVFLVGLDLGLKSSLGSMKSLLFLIIDNLVLSFLLISKRWISQLNKRKSFLCFIFFLFAWSICFGIILILLAWWSFSKGKVVSIIIWSWLWDNFSDPVLMP